MNKKILSILVIMALLVVSLGIVNGEKTGINSMKDCGCNSKIKNKDIDTKDTYQKYRLGSIDLGIEVDPRLEHSFSSSSSTPSKFSWRDIQSIDFTTKPRDQGNCGSCWAFATIGVVESLMKIISLEDSSPNLSEQFMVSCAPSQLTYCDGCDGSSLVTPWPFPNHIDWLKWEKSNGDPSNNDPVHDSCFRYTESDKTDCKRSCSKAVDVNGWGFVENPGNRNNIKKALISRGPLVTKFEVHKDFHSYSGGVYEWDGIIDEDDGWHEVMIVGYDDSKSCWICKNSWGSDWGGYNGDGFFKIRYGECHIAEEAAYIDVDYDSPDFLKEGSDWAKRDDGWVKNGHGALCDKTLGGSANIYYEFDNIPVDVTFPIVIGVQFYSRSYWPTLGGPDIRVKNQKDGGYDLIQKSMGNQDDLAWKYYFVGEDYVSNSGKLRFRIFCADGDKIKIDDVGLSYIEPEPPEPDLEVTGSIQMVNLNPGARKTARIHVKNIGETDSVLDWKVDKSYSDYPSCIEKISPDEGTDLSESSNGADVQVTIKAPNEIYSECSGGIKFINSEDSSDYKVIPVYVSTPKIKNSIAYFLLNSMNRFSVLKEILFSFYQNNFGI